MDYSNLSENRRANMRRAIEKVLDRSPARLVAGEQSCIDFWKNELKVTISTGKRLLQEVQEKRKAEGREVSLPSIERVGLYNAGQTQLRSGQIGRAGRGINQQDAISISSSVHDHEEATTNFNMNSPFTSRNLPTPAPTMSSASQSPCRAMASTQASFNLCSPILRGPSTNATKRDWSERALHGDAGLSDEEIVAYNTTIALACRNFSEKTLEKLRVVDWMYEKQSVGKTVMAVAKAFENEGEREDDNDNLDEGASVQLVQKEEQLNIMSAKLVNLREEYDALDVEYTQLHTIHHTCLSPSELEELRSESLMAKESLQQALSELNARSTNLEQTRRLLNVQEVEIRELDNAMENLKQVSKAQQVQAFEEGVNYGQSKALSSEQLQWLENFKTSEIQEAVESARAQWLHSEQRACRSPSVEPMTVREMKSRIKRSRCEASQRGLRTKRHIKSCKVAGCPHNAHRRTSTYAATRSRSISKEVARLESSLGGYWTRMQTRR